MLPAEVVRRVRNTAGDVNVQQFDNATLTDWINDACLKIAVDNSLLEKQGTFTFVVGDSLVTLPTDIYKLHSVSINGEGLRLESYQDFLEKYDDLVSNATDRGKPNWGYIYAGKLQVFPAPDQAYTLKINYLYTPATIVYSTGPEAWTPNVLPVPVSYHNRIVTYCLAQVALQDDDHNKYQLLMQEFESGVIGTANLSDREDNLYPFINVSARDSGSYFDNEVLW
jgi:hypothetical protein